VIAGGDNVVEMIGQALSAITLGITPENGEKITNPRLPRLRIDGHRVVKEQICGRETVNLLLLQVSKTALRTRTAHRRATKVGENDLSYLTDCQGNCNAGRTAYAVAENWPGR
jgi:hypothetical protein